MKTKRTKSILCTFTTQEKGHNKPVIEAQWKFSSYHAANIDSIMKEAAKKFNIYTITAPDGTIIAKLV